MTEDSRYYPFTSGAGATVSENDWADMALDWAAASGVRLDTTMESVTNPLQAVKNGFSGVNVNLGAAKLRGFHYRLRTALDLTIDANTANGKERQDLICVTLDMTVSPSKVSITLRKGVEAAIGVDIPPAPIKRWGTSTSTTGLYDLPLAVVKVQGTSTVPTIVSVTDLRVFLGSDIQQVLGGVYPSDTFDGQLVFDRDNKRYRSFDSSANGWNSLADMGAFKPYTPSIPGFSHNANAPTRKGSSKVLGGTFCQLNLLYVMPSAFSYSGGDLTMTLPYRSGGDFTQVVPFLWRNSTLSGEKRLGIAEIDGGSAVINRFQWSGASTPDLDTLQSLGANDEIFLSGGYEISP